MDLLNIISKEGKYIAQNDYILVNEIRIHGVYWIELEGSKIKLYDCNNIEIADVFFQDVSQLEIVGEND